MAIVVLMLLITIMLIADFSNPICINSFEYFIENISEQAIKSYDGFTYVVYKHHYSQIMCAKITPSGEVITTEVFSEQFVQLSDPVLEIMDDGSLFVFFTYGREGNLYKAISENNGYSFTTNIIIGNVNEDFYISQNDGEIDMKILILSMRIRLQFMIRYGLVDQVES